MLHSVIPAKAGIHVFQDLKWTPASAGVTAIGSIIYFEIGYSLKFTMTCSFQEIPYLRQGARSPSTAGLTRMPAAVFQPHDLTD